jgi:hypothetical protein
VGELTGQEAVHRSVLCRSLRRGDGTADTCRGSRRSPVQRTSTRLDRLASSAGRRRIRRSRAEPRRSGPSRSAHRRSDRTNLRNRLLRRTALGRHGRVDPPAHV